MFGAKIDVQAKDRLMSAFELKPCREWNIHIRQYLTDYIFRRAPEGQERSGAVLIVDDMPDMGEYCSAVLTEAFPTREVMQASSVQEALALLEKQPCAVIITDIVMYGLTGVDLIKMARDRVPDQIAIGMSGYAADYILTDFCRVGGFIFLAKPVYPDELTRIVTYALRQPQGDAIRKELAEVCDDVAAVWCALHEIAATMDRILKIVGRGNDVAEELLRHKAKHLVNDGLARLGHGVEPMMHLQSVAVQLRCVARLATVVGRLGVQKLGAFIGALISDLRQLHSNIDFGLDDSVSGIQAQVQLGGVVVLAVAELIDNAIIAIGDKGRVDVEVAALKAAGILQIAVKDNGFGVQPGLEDRIFEEHVSTKGTGRGLGLHLVRESLRLLGGSAEYERQNGSIFRVRLPLQSLATERPHRRKQRS